jgi:hypothetical protein
MARILENIIRPETVLLSYWAHKLTQASGEHNFGGPETDINRKFFGPETDRECQSHGSEFVGPRNRHNV